MSGITTVDEGQAVQARTLGREARASISRGNRRPIINPFVAKSFHAYCWQAGYNQDDRNVIELHRDWMAESKGSS